MSKFSENVRYLRNKRAISQEAFAEELQLTRSKVAAYEEARAEPNIHTLIGYSEYFRLPVDALIKTNLTKGREDTFIDIGNNRVLFPILINEDNEDVIELISKEASAGYLQGYSDTEYIANLPIMNLNFLPTGKYRAFPIKGDSMYPWVKDGDFVVAKYMDDPKTVRNNNCYIILTKENGLVYKRIMTDRLEDDFLTLSSDNKQYHPYDLHTSEVLEIWEFTVNLSLGQYEEDEVNPAHVMSLLRSVGVELKDLKGRLDVIETQA